MENQKIISKATAILMGIAIMANCQVYRLLDFGVGDTLIYNGRIHGDMVPRDEEDSSNITFIVSGYAETDSTLLIQTTTMIAYSAFRSDGEETILNYFYTSDGEFHDSLEILKEDGSIVTPPETDSLSKYYFSLYEAFPRSGNSSRGIYHYLESSGPNFPANPELMDEFLYPNSLDLPMGEELYPFVEWTATHYGCASCICSQIQMFLTSSPYPLQYDNPLFQKPFSKGDKITCGILQMDGQSGHIRHHYIKRNLLGQRVITGQD